MEYRESNGYKIDNCLKCDKIRSGDKGEFECTHPVTGYHRYDILRVDIDGMIHFPDWCPLFKTEE